MHSKLELNIDKNTWFVSDTHFHHSKLTEDCPDRFEFFRHYKNIEEMDSDIITKWNEYVKPEDTVIFGGDFLMNTKSSEVYDEFWNLRNQLNGNIYFIRGNHDFIIQKKIKEITFYDYAVLHYNDKILFVQHKDYIENRYFKAKESENGMNFENVILIHGHTHSSEKYKNDMINICWEAWYRPVNAEEILNVNRRNEM